MSNPSFSNIDLWLFELAEGNLTPSQVEQLEMFLLRHPELDVERDVWEMTKVNKEEIIYPNSQALERKTPLAWYSVGASTVMVIGLLLFSVVGSFEYDFKLDEPAKMKAQRWVLNPNSGLFSMNSDKEPNSNADSGNSTSQSVQSVNSSLQNSSSHETGVTDQVAGLVSSESIAVQSEVDRTKNEDYQKVTNFEEGILLTEQAVSDFNATTLLEKGGDTFNEESVAAIDDAAKKSNERTSSSYGIHADHYNLTFRNRVKQFGRKIRRMMDNPVALQNFKDPHYHVPGMLATDINIGSIGTMIATRVQTNSRVQWLNEEGEQFMNQIAVDGYVYAVRGGLGLQVNHSMYKDGAMNDINVAFTYSPKIAISRTVSLEPALRFKMGNKSFNSGALEDVDAVELDRGNVQEFYANGLQPIGNDLWYQDLGAGVMVNTEWFFVGAQADNLFRHRDNIYTHDIKDPKRAGVHFLATFGTDWVSRKKNLGLSPYLVYQYNERLSEAWLGANFRWNWFTIGAGVSTGLEPAASMGIKFEHFALNYNADYVKSDLTGKKSLSHQLSLKFVGKPSKLGRKLLNR